MIDGGMRPNPAMIFALSRACIHAEPEVRIHLPPASSRESTNYQFLSAKPIGSGSAVDKFVQIRDRM